MPRISIPTAARNSPSSLPRWRAADDKFVKSKLVKSASETIAFNYRMHQVGSEWKITDVYLAGNISQMAQKRSDFSLRPWRVRADRRAWRSG